MVNFTILLQMCQEYYKVIVSFISTLKILPCLYIFFILVNNFIKLLLFNN